MKKNLISILILSLFIFSGCKSFSSKGRSVNTAQKYIKNGNYYEGVIAYTTALMTDPDYKPAIEGLNETFNEALLKQESLISVAKTSGTPTVYANEVEKMAILYKNVSRLRPESFDLLNFKLDFQDIKYWNNETAKAYYEAAKNYTPRQTTFDYKAIAKLYKKSYQYNPKYEDNFDKYRQSKDLAMQNIVYFELKHEYNYFNIGALLNNKIFTTLSSDSNISEFTVFKNGSTFDKNSLLSKTFTEDELKNTNYFLDIQVSSINFSKPTPVTNYKNNTWYEVSKQTNGVIKKEAISFLPKTLDPQATYTEKKYTRISTSKEISVTMIISYSLIDLKSKNTIKSGLITDKAKDSHVSNLLIGDIPSSETPVLDRSLVNDLDLLETLSGTISEKLKNELKPILE